MKFFNLLICLLLVNNFSSYSHEQAEELGRVNWIRDYSRAIEKAKEENKAVLILFQEVPGCATCRNYGNNVLSHPLMVELIENEFIPLAIFNNKGGEDKKILDKYYEPSWNNPVVRIVDSGGENIVPRLSNNYSSLGLINTIEIALQKSGKDLPLYAELLRDELSISNSNESYFKMYCFWTGEKQLGSLEGVLDTESGFNGPSEVVKITFDPEIISFNELESFAQNNKMESIKSEDIQFRKSEKDLHYYLQNSDYKYIPLTKLQQTKINSALGRKESVVKFLSPKQKLWLENVKTGENPKSVVFNKDFFNAWIELDS